MATTRSVQIANAFCIFALAAYRYWPWRDICYSVSMCCAISLCHFKESLRGECPPRAKSPQQNVSARAFKHRDNGRYFKGLVLGAKRHAAPSLTCHVRRISDKNPALIRDVNR